RQADRQRPRTRPRFREDAGRSGSRETVGGGMSLLFKLKMARQSAEKILRDEGIDELAVDPFAIAASRGIVVQAKPDTADGVSGMLLRRGNSFGILYATYIPSEGFQRFSVAHELGHYFLEGHPDAVLGPDGIHASSAGFTS